MKDRKVLVFRTHIGVGMKGATSFSEKNDGEMRLTPVGVHILKTDELVPFSNVTYVKLGEDKK